MTSILPRLLAGIILSAAVTGAAAAYQTAAQPIDGAQIATWEDLRAALPQDTRCYRETIRYNQAVLHEMTGGAVPEDDGKDWSETVIYAAYDPAGRVVATFSDAGGRLVLSLREYDRVGNHVHSVTYRNNALLTEMTTVFDEEGREISSESRSEDKISTRSERSYEPQPDGTTRAAVTVYDAYGAVIERDNHILDDKNRVIHSEVVLGGYTAVADYTYDDRDRLIRSVVDGETGRSDKAMVYTDAPDGSTCAQYYENGVLQSRTEQQFDALGVCVLQEDYDADGTLVMQTIREPLKM